MFSCFDSFFRLTNVKENKLALVQRKPRGGVFPENAQMTQSLPLNRRQFMVSNLELVGLDYIWKMLLSSHEAVASRAIHLLKTLYTSLSPSYSVPQVCLSFLTFSRLFARLLTY